MNKKYLLVLFALYSLQSIAQNSIPLDTLISLANCSSSNKFDSRVRHLGYSFESSSKEGENAVCKRYTKRVKSGGYVYTFYLSYIDYQDGKPVVVFSSPADLTPSLLERTKVRLTSLNLQEDPTCSSGDDNVLTMCYSNSRYRVILGDMAMREDDYNKYNVYKVKVYKR